MSSSVSIHLKSLHWLPVKIKSTYKIAYLCYHCHSSTAQCAYVTDMLHKKQLHTHNTHSILYTTPLLNRPAHSKATLGDRSFSFASSVWNYIIYYILYIYIYIYIYILYILYIIYIYIIYILYIYDVRCALSLSSFNSVALKTCEQIVLPQLMSFIHDSLDPFQLTYQSNRSCEDDILVTIIEVTSHLDSKISKEKNNVSGIITNSRNSVIMMFF